MRLTAMERNASKPLGVAFDLNVVVLRLRPQWHEADEAARFVLQRAQLPQMIHAVGANVPPGQPPYQGIAAFSR